MASKLSRTCAGAAVIAILTACAASSSAPMPNSADFTMAATALSKSTLIYAADSRTGYVSVYDYSDGAQVATITGTFLFSAGCVDAKGDVYIASGDGDAYEYAHGGTTPLKTYSPGGQLDGCSVDANGDLALSSTSPAIVTVSAKGDPNSIKTYSSSECLNLAASGYDDKGDIIGEGGEYKSLNICAILKGARAMATRGTSGIAIKELDGTMWDGKYIAVSDEEAGTGQTGIYEASLSGTTLSAKHEVILTDTCYRGLVAVTNPFVLGARNTPANDTQGKVVVGANGYCGDSSSGPVIELWHYPKGGNPFKEYSTADAVTVLAVSIGT